MKLFVGNLPFTANEDDLRPLFSAYGEVNGVQIVQDRGTGRSKGFAFIEMADDTAARAAIAALHGNDFQGRALSVSEAKPREDRPGSAGGGGGGGYGGYGGGGSGGSGGGRGRPQ